MKKIIIIVIALSVIYSCKKETNNPTVAGGTTLSSGGNILISHKWYLTHQYVDTTLFASTHLSQLPLATSEEVSSPYDTCSRTTKAYFKNDGYWVNIKGKTCFAFEPDTSSNYTWSLGNYDTKIIMNGTILDVLELTPTKFKIAISFPQKDSNNQIMYYETNIEIFEPAP